MRNDEINVKPRWFEINNQSINYYEDFSSIFHRTPSKNTEMKIKHFYLPGQNIKTINALLQDSPMKQCLVHDIIWINPLILWSEISNQVLQSLQIQWNLNTSPNYQQYPAHWVLSLICIRFCIRTINIYKIIYIN